MGYPGHPEARLLFLLTPFLRRTQRRPPLVRPPSGRTRYRRIVKPRPTFRPPRSSLLLILVKFHSIHRTILKVPAFIIHCLAMKYGYDAMKYGYDSSWPPSNENSAPVNKRNLNVENKSPPGSLPRQAAFLSSLWALKKKHREKREQLFASSRHTFIGAFAPSTSSAVGP